MTCCGASPPALGDIVRFDGWTLVQDPAHPDLSGTVDSPSRITLLATPRSTIPPGTDVGYQSIDGPDVAGSARGSYFSTMQDFHVAVDFDVAAQSTLGLAVLGLGIGEDRDGANSAGVALAVLHGIPTGFAAAGRIDDVTQSPLSFAASATSSGRLFVRYDSATGDVVLGVHDSQGSPLPAETRTFAAIQKNWDQRDLAVSVFLRSDTVPGVAPPLSAGTLTARFSNFQVLDGNPVSVPEPRTYVLMGLGCLVLLASRRRVVSRESRVEGRELRVEGSGLRVEG